MPSGRRSLRNVAFGVNKKAVIPSSSNLYCNPDILLRLVRSGSAQAIDRITRCYGDRLLRAGRRRCRTAAEAEDAVQDALLHVSEHIDSFRGEGSLEGWLVRLVTTSCYRQARGLKHDAARHDTQLLLVDNAPSPLDLSCRGELARALQSALLELSPVDRSIVLLADVEGWQASEIAAEIGLTAGAVRTRLSRSRARLREEISSVLSGA